MLVIADTARDLARGCELCEDLISTVEAQRQRTIRLKAAKRIDKKKGGKGVVNLPEGLIAAMRVYYPGHEPEPAPPGSAADARVHRARFRAVGRQLGWFADG